MGEYQDDTVVSCCLAIHTLKQYSHEGQSGGSASAYLFLNEFGQITEKPAWQRNTIGVSPRSCSELRFSPQALKARYDATPSSSCDYRLLRSPSSRELSSVL